MSTTPATAPAAPAAGTTLMTAPPAGAPAGAPAAPAGDGSTPPAGDPAPAAPAGGAPAGEPAKEGEGAPAKTPEELEAERVAAEEAAKAGEKPAGAPEQYEPFTPPEGAQLDQAVMDQFAETARDLNLPQDQAQKLIDKMAPAIAQRQAEQVESVRAEWHAQATADKEFGGDKLGENLAVAKVAMDKFATPELTQLLNDTGLGNHPEVIRFMVRAGKAIGEDKVVTGGVPGATTQRSAADVLYGGSALKK